MTNIRKMKVSDSLMGAIKIVNQLIKDLDAEIESTPRAQWDCELYTAMRYLFMVKESLIWSDTLCEHEIERNYQSFQDNITTEY